MKRCPNVLLLGQRRRRAGGNNKTFNILELKQFKNAFITPPRRSKMIKHLVECQKSESIAKVHVVIP